MDKENVAPKLCLSLKKKRFAVIDTDEMEQYSRIKVSKHTEQSNNRAVRNFKEWQRDYNGRNPDSKIRDDVLENLDFQELDGVLSTYIVETRKENGEKYPP